MTSVIIIVCCVVIIGIVLNKNNRLQSLMNSQAENDEELKSTVKQMMDSGEKDTTIIKYVRKETGINMVDAKKFVDNIR